MKLCTERPAAPSTPTLACAWMCASSSRWWSTSARSARKKKTKPAPDERAHQLRVVDRLDRFRQDVEERDGDDDAAGERDRRRQLAREPQPDHASDERRQHRHPRQGNRDPVHAQRLQVP